jgi:hypothetical protein
MEAERAKMDLRVAMIEVSNSNEEMNISLGDDI